MFNRESGGFKERRRKKNLFRKINSTLNNNYEVEKGGFK